MPSLKIATHCLLIILIGATASADDFLIHTPHGEVRLQLAPVPAELRNEWPAAEEQQFQERVRHVMNLYGNGSAGGRGYGNTFFENEKASYPRAMFDLLHGNVDSAVKHLQEPDNLAKDNAHTAGIDFFPCFTLKGQVRKYFLFGKFLDDEYRGQMREAARLWTERDPLRRPHPVYGDGDRSIPGWLPQTWGSWVDIRNTDNLRAMRDTSVYLFAEATGNDEVREIYKKKLQGYVAALYHVGMSEWDSENYLSHGVAPYLSLYDFAQDREVKALAKAYLDWMMTAAAVKYYRGGFGGPNKRDYGGANVVFGASAAKFFWLYFGDCPVQVEHVEHDWIHAVTSTYRPPSAVLALDRKQFDKPVTLQNTKPAYGVNFPADADEPAYWETLAYGQTYQLGTVVSRISGDVKGLDVSTCKLLAYNTRRGVDFMVVNTAAAGEQVEAVSSSKRPGDQVAQHGPVALWLRRDDQPGTQFVVQLPRTAQLSYGNDWWFVELEKTYVGFLPLHLGKPRTAGVTHNKLADNYAQEQLLIASTTGGPYSGFAMVVGEPESFGSFGEFRDTLQKQAAWELARLDQGIVEFAEPHTGTRLKMFYNVHNDRPGVIRNGSDADWDNRYEVYRPLKGNRPVTLGWKEGTLRVEAGGNVFASTVSSSGIVGQ